MSDQRDDRPEAMPSTERRPWVVPAAIVASVEDTENSAGYGSDGTQRFS